MSQSDNQFALTVQASKNLTPEMQKYIMEEAEKERKRMLDSINVEPPKIRIGKDGYFLMGSNDTPIKTIKGIILASSKAFCYWHKEDLTCNPVLLDLPDDVNFSIPLCYSFDGLTGSRMADDAAADGLTVRVFGKCTECYLNKFGTMVDNTGKKQKAKACKNGRRILIMPDGKQIPHLITFSPTSIKVYDKYVMEDLVAVGKPFWAVWTEFTLTTKREDDGRSYSVLMPPKYAGDVDFSAMPALLQIRNQFIEATTSTITHDEFESPDSDSGAEVVV